MQAGRNRALVEKPRSIEKHELILCLAPVQVVKSIR